MALTEQQLTQTSPEIIGLERQRKLADLLTAQAFQQPQGQMISGHYVAPSWTQQLAPMANILAGNAISERADKQQSELAAALRNKGAQETKAIIELAKTNPEAALALASNAETAQGKAFAPTLMQNYLPKKTDKLIEYDTYKQEGGKLPFSEWVNRLTPEQEARLAIDRQRLGLEGARLGLEKEKLAAELGGGKLNNEQGQAVGFGTRAKEASEQLKTLEAKGVLNTGLTRTGIASTLGMTPFMGDKLEQNAMTALNWTASPEQQATLQARKNFATAVLRKESGASISPTEFADVDRIYFPQPGDGKDVVARKQRARDLAIQSLEVQAGPGARLIKEFKPQTEFNNNKVVDFNDLK